MSRSANQVIADRVVDTLDMLGQLSPQFELRLRMRGSTASEIATVPGSARLHIRAARLAAKP